MVSWDEGRGTRDEGRGTRDEGRETRDEGRGTRRAERRGGGMRGGIRKERGGDGEKDV